MNRIGTTIYYCVATGEVLARKFDREGTVITDTTFEQDLLIYERLMGRDVNSIGTLTFEFGVFGEIVKDATGYTVDLETKQLVLTFEPLPEIPHEPDKIELLEGKVSTLETENSKLLLDNAVKTSEINTLTKNTAILTLEVAKMKGER